MRKIVKHLRNNRLTASLLFLLLGVIGSSLAVWAVTSGPLSYLSKAKEVSEIKQLA